MFVSLNMTSDLPVFAFTLRISSSFCKRLRRSTANIKGSLVNLILGIY